MQIITEFAEETSWQKLLDHAAVVCTPIVCGATAEIILLWFSQDTLCWTWVSLYTKKYSARISCDMCSLSGSVRKDWEESTLGFKFLIKTLLRILSIKYRGADSKQKVISSTNTRKVTQYQIQLEYSSRLFSELHKKWEYQETSKVTRLL